MKVLHISTSLVMQSAAYRIHKALLKNNIDSFNYVLVNTNMTSHDNRTLCDSKKYSFLLNRIKGFIHGKSLKLLKKDIDSPFSFGNLSSLDRELIRKINPDIIHLHWICGNFISFRDFEFLRKYRLVWTLHDSWAFTGGCHIPYECKGYMSGCENCNRIMSRVAKAQLLNKRKNYPEDITIVTPSKWMMECALKSAIFFDKKVVTVPNLIFTHEYKPISLLTAREIINLDLEKKYILFGAVNSTSDSNKGFNYVQKALKKLYDSGYLRNEIRLIVFGGNEPAEKIDFGYKAIYKGVVNDDIALNILYSAADVMLVPSKSENFPNVVLESMSSGTPCVAFKVGGIPEIIEHKVNGYLAKPFDIDDFSNGIKYILNDNGDIASKAREKIVNNYSDEIIAAKYIDLYKKIIL